MKITENPDLREELLDYQRDLHDGKVTLPAIDYRRDLTYYHRSELLGCAMIPYLVRTVPPEDVPKINDSALLYFTRGRAVERIFGADNKPIVKDGIIVSVDRMSVYHGLVEMKSTVMSSNSFPGAFHDKRKDWIDECAIVAAAYGFVKCNIAIVFLVGNTRSKGVATDDRKAVELKVWGIEFDEADLWTRWRELVNKKALIETCVLVKDPPSAQYVTASRETWRCKECRYNSLCKYANMKEENK